MKMFDECNKEGRFDGGKQASKNAESVKQATRSTMEPMVNPKKKEESAVERIMRQLDAKREGNVRRSSRD